MVVEEKSKKIKSLSDLENSTFAVVEGMIYDERVLGRLPHARIEYFRTIFDCLSALKNGEVDAVPYDDAPLRHLLAFYPESYLLITDDYFKGYDYGFAVNLYNRDLKKAIDDTIAELKSSGIYQEMINRWFSLGGAIGIMPRINLSGKNGKLRLGRDC